MNKSILPNLNDVTVIDVLEYGAHRIIVTNENFVRFCNSHFLDGRQVFLYGKSLFVVYQGVFICTELEGDNEQ